MTVEAMLDGYWQNRPSQPVFETIMADWMDELEAFEPAEIRAACRSWTRENPRRKPNFGDIVGVLRDVRRDACRPHISDMARICREVADKRGVAEWVLRGQMRSDAACDARAEAMAMCKALGVSEPLIGEFFGGRDHTSVRKGLERWDRIKDRQRETITDDQRAEVMARLSSAGARA